MIGRTRAKVARRTDDFIVGEAPYDLTLFVSGASSLSGRAIANARRLCEIHLDGRYHLSVVDVHGEPSAAGASGSVVMAVPTLVRNRPLPERRVVGDISDTAKALLALEIPAAGDRT